MNYEAEYQSLSMLNVIFKDLKKDMSQKALVESNIITFYTSSFIHSNKAVMIYVILKTGVLFRFILINK